MKLSFMFLRWKKKKVTCGTCPRTPEKKTEKIQSKLEQQ
jgi:hypothetical protein